MAAVTAADNLFQYKSMISQMNLLDFVHNEELKWVKFYILLETLWFKHSLKRNLQIVIT